MEHLDLIEAATRALGREALAGDDLRVRCLLQLDREKIFVDLCEHHDHRERRYLYPALERILDERAKVELLERMVGPGPSAEVRL